MISEMKKRNCKIEGCFNKYATAGYCMTHYQKLRIYGDPFYIPPAKSKKQIHFCTIANCNSKQHSNGYCKLHYSRWKRHGDPNIVLKVRAKQKDPLAPEAGKSRKCSINECNNIHYAKDYCIKHYARWRKNGDPLIKSTKKKESILCSIAGCFNIHNAKGYCQKHYVRWKRHGDPNTVLCLPHGLTKGILKCKVEGCDYPHLAKGYCTTHYQRWKTTGDPLKTKSGIFGKKEHRPKCKIVGCMNISSGRAMCAYHYDKWYRYGDPLKTGKIKKKICKFDTCERHAKYNDYCKQHYVIYMKSLIFEAYGNCCVCCGETRSEFLNVDHIHSDGKEDRKKGMWGYTLYKYIIENDYPKDRYQLLCWNCNMTKSQFGKCAHDLKSDEVKLTYMRKLKLQVNKGYGGKCDCCGETIPWFLSIDHIYNDGNKEREAGLKSSTFLKYLVENNYPKDKYQLLCLNCNIGKWHNHGMCPHQADTYLTI